MIEFTSTIDLSSIKKMKVEGFKMNGILPVYHNFKKDKAIGWLHVGERVSEGVFEVKGEMDKDAALLICNDTHKLSYSMSNPQVEYSLGRHSSYVPEITSLSIVKKNQDKKITARASDLIKSIGVDAEDAAHALMEAVKIIPDDIWDMVDAEMERRGLK